MHLRTLGGLELEGARFTRPKPLLLLCFLALEGTQERRHVAELFWPRAADRMKSLTVALSQLRSGVPGVIESDDRRVRADIGSDVEPFLELLERQAFEPALERYRGPFLAGLRLAHWGEELEEWVYRTREILAGRARGALLELAERTAGRGDFEGAAKRAETAFRLPGAAPPDPDDLRRLHALLLAGHSPYAAEAAEEAQALGIRPEGSAAEARAELQSVKRSEPSVRLPAAGTPFVGRRDEIAALERLLLEEPDCRLVTLIGPGGIGKTRLALEVAARLAPAFRDGVFFVDLTAIESPDSIVSAIAASLELAFYGDTPADEQLHRYLAGRRLLLVLDNCEHVLAGAGAIAALLPAAPDLALLATSRESLRLPEEWRFEVEGLSFPAEGADLAAGSWDAPLLFEDRARRARVRVPLAAEREQLARLCRMVEGTPLALELAAGWLPVLPLESITAELASGLDILTNRLRGVSERHQSMRAVLEHSWRLLSPQQQNVLRRLSVFRGGFRREAAEAVAGASLLTLAALVDKSLVRAGPAGRYRMHELLRQFAAEKLAEETAEEDGAHERHSRFFLAFLAQLEEEIVGREQRRTLERIDEERDNIRLAWTRAVEQNDHDGVERALDGLYHFHRLGGDFPEGEERFGFAADTWRSTNTPLLGRLLARRGAFSSLLGRYEAARTELETARTLVDEARERAFVATRLSELAHLRGDPAGAETYGRQAISLYRNVGDPGGLADALTVLSSMYGTFADFAGAVSCAEEALAICRHLDRPDRVAATLSILAWPLSCLGRYREAETRWRESLELYRAGGDRHGVAMATNFLGWALWCAGDLEKAMDLYQQALSRYREVGHRQHVAMCLGDMALAASDLGEYDRALAYGREGAALAADIGHVDLAAYNRIGLGAAACGLGDFAASRRHLAESVIHAIEKRVPDKAVIALYHLARLLLAETPGDGPADREAMLLLHFVAEHPACWQAFRDRAARLLASLATDLSPAALSDLEEQARRQTLERIAARHFGAVPPPAPERGVAGGPNGHGTRRPLEHRDPESRR